MKKIAVVTGTRAEYGLLYWLMRALRDDPEIELQIIVTGMHLSSEFGYTYREIEKEFPIDYKVDMLLSSDTSSAIAKSIGLCGIGFADAYENLKPDFLVVLGDRFEVLAAATAAMIYRIPIGHIHGGEATEGLIDEPIRHAVTKMSHLHFTATEEYRRRVIQLGENPDRVFNVGGMGVDCIRKMRLLDRATLEREIGFTFGPRNVLVTFHPVTLENATAEEQFGELLAALDTLDAKVIFTKPNADTGGRVIIGLIDDYVRRNPDRCAAFVSMGQLRYLSALQFVDAAVGNSSSGLLEAPSFKIGTIDIGDRQRGRIKADSVLDCAPERDSIIDAFRTLYSPAFQERLKSVQNPYGEGMASDRIHALLRDADFGNLLKKSFYDVEFPA